MPGVLPLPFDQDSDAKDSYYCMMIDTDHTEFASHCQADTDGDPRACGTFQFVVSPIVADREIVISGLTAPRWEGALQVRRDSSAGPLVGRIYMEEQFGANDRPLPVGGPLARQLPLSGVS